MGITIAGKEYTAKRVTLSTLKKVAVLEKRMADLDKKLEEGMDFDEYDKAFNALWLQKVSFMIEGGVSDLSFTVLRPQEVSALESFFYSLVMDEAKSTKENSSGTPSQTKAA